MEQPEQSSLKQEIAFRGRLIEALLSANEELRAKCSQLFSLIEAKREFYSPTEQEFISKLTVHSILQQQIVSNQPVYSNTQQDMEASQVIHSSTQQQVETSQPDYSNTQQSIEANQVIHSSTQLQVETNQPVYSNTQQEVATSQADGANTSLAMGINQIIEPLPLKLNPQGGIVSYIRVQLETLLNYHSRKGAMRAATQLLIHIYNDQPGEYKYMSKATGHSTGGLAKMLMRLRKQGLIQRTAFQKFALTPRAMSLLNEAWAKYQAAVNFKP